MHLFFLQLTKQTLQWGESFDYGPDADSNKCSRVQQKWEKHKSELEVGADGQQQCWEAPHV